MGTELKDTFVQAYNDTYDYINCYLTSKLPTRDLIEDALQSVYLDFYRSLITTQGKIKNVRHYVLRIAKHYVADHYRQQPKATFEDITDLGLSQSTVKSRLYRTLDKLKKTYCEKEEQSNENDRYNEKVPQRKQV